MSYELGSSLKNCLLVFYTVQKQGTELDKIYLSLLVDLVNLLVLHLSKGLTLLCCFHHFNDFCCWSVDWLSILWFYSLLLLANMSIKIHRSIYQGFVYLMFHTWKLWKQSVVCAYCWVLGGFVSVDGTVYVSYRCTPLIMMSYTWWPFPLILSSWRMSWYVFNQCLFLHLN